MYISALSYDIHVFLCSLWPKLALGKLTAVIIAHNAGLEQARVIEPSTLAIVEVTVPPHRIVLHDAAEVVLLRMATSILRTSFFNLCE